MMQFCVLFGSVSYAFLEPHCNFGFLFVKNQVCTVNVFATVFFFWKQFEFSFKAFAEPLNLEFDLTDYEGNF